MASKYLSGLFLDKSTLVVLKREALGIVHTLEEFSLMKVQRDRDRVAHESAGFYFKSGSHDILVGAVSPTWHFGLTKIVPTFH